MPLRVGIGIGVSFGAAAKALLSVDFVNGVYQKSGVNYPLASLPGWSFSRASTGYAQTTAGLLINFASGAPRITNQGLLVEASATNLMTQSQGAFATGWTPSSLTVTDNNIVSPDGTTTASSLVDNGANVTHNVNSPSVTLTSGANYTVSVYGKPGAPTGSASLLQLLGSSAGWGTFYVNYDLTNAVVTASVNGTGTIASTGVKSVTNGFVRSIVTVKALSTSGTIGVTRIGTSTDTRVQTYSGSGTTVGAWGVQVEAGNTASSYIPTTAAAATRAADVASLTFSGAPAKATITYGAGQTAIINNPTSPLDLGASSGGAWVGSYIQKVVIQ